jgi:uncharacterized OsmC-like protein
VEESQAATVSLDTDVNDWQDAFNPAELFLAAIAACMIKEIERVTSMLKCDIRGVEVHMRGVRQDRLPKKASLRVVVDTDEDDHRLELLHQNVMKYGTATQLQGVIRRRI